MLDNRLLEAFAAVLEEKGFERAAVRLGLTQSAISQRIRQLEDELGSVLIVRESPPRPTAAGERLLRHYRQLADLEAEVLGELGTAESGATRHLPIAVNTDSLSIWLLDALAPFLREREITVEILVEEQDRVLDFLRSGVVAACVSPHRASVQGCSAREIGVMRYLLVAAPGFAERHFPQGLDREAAARAPIVHSNREDRLQLRALEGALGRLRSMPPAHYIPSTEKYFDLVAAGLGYGLVSSIQALPAIRAGRLREVDERARIEVPLFWHRWNRYSGLLEELTEAVLTEGARLLAPA